MVELELFSSLFFVLLALFFFGCRSFLVGIQEIAAETRGENLFINILCFKDAYKLLIGKSLHMSAEYYIS